MAFSWPAHSGLVVLYFSAVVGCAPVPASTPTPSPAYQCVPEAGGDPVPCTSIEFETSRHRDALYSEGEAVYRRYWSEVTRVRLSAEPSMTPDLEETTAGNFREGVRQLIEDSRGAQRVSGDAPVVWVKRLPVLTRSGSIVALEVCTDATTARYANPQGGSPTAGRAFQQRIYLARLENAGALRIVDSEYKEVAAC